MDGYKVYRAASKNGKYKLVLTTNTNRASATVMTKSLKKGSAYYYMVKGFRNVNGVKVYTKTSVKVSAKAI